MKITHYSVNLIQLMLVLFWNKGSFCVSLHDLQASCLFVYIIIFWQLKFWEGREGVNETAVNSRLMSEREVLTCTQSSPPSSFLCWKLSKTRTIVVHTWIMKVQPQHQCRGVVKELVTSQAQSLQKNKYLKL